jgi:antibiotic biosynthesis monooxygenase (ABM) superfamily enzyme
MTIFKDTLYCVVLFIVLCFVIIPVYFAVLVLEHIVNFILKIMGNKDESS